MRLSQQYWNITQMISNAGFSIKAMKLTKLTRLQAQKFYAVHKERPFYDELVEYMTSGPIVVAILEKKMQWRIFEI